MADHTRLEALRRAQQFAETIRRAAASIDGRTAPGLGADLVRAAGVVVAGLADRPGPSATPAVWRRLATVASALSELETLLAMAAGLEVLGARGPRLVEDLTQLRRLLADLRRRLREASPGHAA